MISTFQMNIYKNLLIMFDDDVDTGDGFSAKDLWNDTSVSASLLKILLAVWLVGAFILIIQNLLTLF